MNSVYKRIYKTPHGFSNIIMESDGKHITSVRFIDGNVPDLPDCDAGLFHTTEQWLDAYFSGRAPGTTPRYRIYGSTPFRDMVIDIVKQIPYGKTMTYGEIAQKIAYMRGIPRVSARAVGGAIGWNPICIIIPCHRVVGVGGKITGYNGGIKNKIALMRHEDIN